MNEQRNDAYNPWESLKVPILILGAFVFEIAFFVIASATISSINDNANAAKGSNASRTASTAVNVAPVNVAPANRYKSSNVSSATTTANSANNNGRTATLTWDVRLREFPGSDQPSVGIHYKGARIRVFESREAPNDENGMSTWYRISVTSYGTSILPENQGRGKDEGSADDGWINSYPKVWDPKTRVSRHKNTINFD